MLAPLPLAEAVLAGPRAPRTTRVYSADELRRALRAAPEVPAVLDASGLDRILCLDATRGLIEVQSALRWRALAAFLGDCDDAFKALADHAALGESVGAAVASNAAGPDGRPMVAHIESLTVVTPDGELRRTSRSINPKLFALAVGGHGIFGVLYSITLRVASLRTSLAGATRAARFELDRSTPGQSIESQLLVPPANLESLLAALRARAEEWRLALTGLEVRRTLPEDETMLRWATREYAALRVRLAAPPTLGGWVRATQVQRALLEVAMAHGGAFPIASTRCATRAQLDACYPRLAAFLAEKRHYDPHERLVNEWYRHHCALVRDESSKMRWSN